MWNFDWPLHVPLASAILTKTKTVTVDFSHDAKCKNIVETSNIVTVCIIVTLRVCRDAAICICKSFHFSPFACADSAGCSCMRFSKSCFFFSRDFVRRSSSAKTSGSSSFNRKISLAVHVMFGWTVDKTNKNETCFLSCFVVYWLALLAAWLIVDLFLVW